jgi:pyruvate dehydrogenase E1 component beta subunit
MERCLYSLERPVRRVCGRNVPVPFAPVMENFAIPGAAELVAAAREMA